MTNRPDPGLRGDTDRYRRPPPPAGSVIVIGNTPRPDLSGPVAPLPPGVRAGPDGTIYYPAGSTPIGDGRVRLPDGTIFDPGRPTAGSEPARPGSGSAGRPGSPPPGAGRPGSPPPSTSRPTTPPPTSAPPTGGGTGNPGQIGSAQWYGIVESYATRFGVPSDIVLAIIEAESGGNQHAIGDGGASVGLFQMHERGRGAGLSVEQRYDITTQFERSMPEIQRAYEQATREGLAGTELVVRTAMLAQRPAAGMEANYRRAYERVIAWLGGGGGSAGAYTPTIAAPGYGPGTSPMSGPPGLGSTVMGVASGLSTVFAGAFARGAMSTQAAIDRGDAIGLAETPLGPVAVDVETVVNTGAVVVGLVLIGVGAYIIYRRR